MMHDAVAQPVLRIAGKFPAADQKIVAAIEAGVCAELPHSVHNGTDILREFNLLLRRVLNERELSAAEIGVDRPAAGHAAHDGDPPLQKRAHMHLAADILIAPDDDRGPVAPQQQHVVLTVIPEHIVLKRLIEKRVV